MLVTCDIVYVCVYLGDTTGRIVASIVVPSIIVVTLIILFVVVLGVLIYRRYANKSKYSLPPGKNGKCHDL